MALTDNFETYTAGDLNGQGSWVGNASYDVQTSVVNSGVNAISNATGGDVEIEKTFTAQAAGIQSFYVRTTSTSRDMEVNFDSGATSLIRTGIRITTNGQYQLFNTAATNVSAVSVNTWYKIEVEWDASLGTNGQFRARVDGGTWSSWVEAIADFTTVDTVRFSNDALASTAYWDDFSDATPVASSAVSRRRMLLGIGA